MEIPQNVREARTGENFVVVKPEAVTPWYIKGMVEETRRYGFPQRNVQRLVDTKRYSMIEGFVRTMRTFTHAGSEQDYNTAQIVQQASLAELMDDPQATKDYVLGSLIAYHMVSTVIEDTLADPNVDTPNSVLESITELARDVDRHMDTAEAYLNGDKISPDLGLPFDVFMDARDIKTQEDFSNDVNVGVPDSIDFLAQLGYKLTA